MGSTINGIYIPDNGETGWGSEVSGNQRRLAEHHVNVKAYGAVGDGATDDTTAITNAISAAYASHVPVYFPGVATSYKITSTIDLTAYPGIAFVGEGSRQGINGQMGRGTTISAPSSVSPMFKFDGDGNAFNFSFENLAFNGAECAVRISDSANVTFKNCAFSVPDTGGANNTCVLLENMFWVWFDDCHFNAPSTSAGDGSVILRGKEPSPNSDHNYLIHFRRCRFWGNGVYYRDQNEVAVEATQTEAITFEDCDCENFASTSALIEFTKTAGTNWGGRYVKYLTLRNVRSYDQTGSPAVVRSSVPNGIDLFSVDNVLGFPRLFEMSSGVVTRGHVTGFVGDPVVNGAGTVQQGQFGMSTYNLESWGGTVILHGSATTFAYVTAGSGTPEGVVSAPVGSLFLRTDGGAGTSLYIKETGGAGNTGWNGVVA
jgi:hypothetical protein